MSNVRVESMLRDWASNGHDSMLVFQAGKRAQIQATELEADVVNYLRRPGHVENVKVSLTACANTIALSRNWVRTTALEKIKFECTRA